MGARVWRVAAGLAAATSLIWQASGVPVAQTVSPPDVGMHRSLDVILDTYVREGLVYYRALRSERGRLDSYVSALDVPRAAFEAWSREEQAAFWLNAYNALVLRTVVNAYPIKGKSPQYPADSIQHVAGAFVAKRHRVGGRQLSLEDIEKQILPTFDDPRMFVTVSDTNVRERPTTKSGKIATLPRRSKVEVVGKVPGSPWYRIVRKGSGIGFVHAKLIQPAS